MILNIGDLCKILDILDIYSHNQDMFLIWYYSKIGYKGGGIYSTVSKKFFDCLKLNCTTDC